MRWSGVALLVATAVALVCAEADAGGAGSQSPLTIHVIAHSHCDAGYHLSFEQYYETDVQHILTSVVAALQDPAGYNRTFVWEETSFFARWWSVQDNSTQQAVRELVAAGKLEFIGGGFVMHDEGATDLEPILNQFYIGLQYLQQTLNVRPRYGWHIDPFGHSAFTPTLYALMGYSAFVGNRIPDALKQQLRAVRQLEFVWRADPDLLQPNAQYELMTHILDSHYGTPPLQGDSLPVLGQQLIDIARTRSQWYPSHGQILIPFGGDFNFVNATQQFLTLEHVIQYANEVLGPQQNVSVRYSTLNDYFTAVHNAQPTLMVQSAVDLFPYIACSPCGAAECYTQWDVPCGSPDAVWSGYFTSKPYQKWTARRHDALLRQAELLFALREQPQARKAEAKAQGTGASANVQVPWPPGPDQIPEVLDIGRNNSGIMQHHDAMPGTAFPPAFDDYNVRLSASMPALDAWAGVLKAGALTHTDGDPIPVLNAAPQLEALLNQLNASNAVAVAVGNTLGWSRPGDVVRLGPLSAAYVPPNGMSLTVVDGTTQQAVVSQFVSDPIRSQQWLYFACAPIDGLQIQTYFITLAASADAESAATDSGADHVPGAAPTSFFNGAIGLTFDANGKVNGFVNASSGGAAVGFAYDLWQYPERAEDDIGNVCTGANVYTFVPFAGQPPKPLAGSTVPVTSVAAGPLVWEATQSVNDFAAVTYRLFGAEYVDPLLAGVLEVQTRLGPLPDGIEDLNSFNARISTTAIHNTDLVSADNGYALQHHVVDPTQSLQFNTWPMPAFAYVSDSTGASLSVAAQRPMGVSQGYTNAAGQMEVMLHRRMNQSDPRSDDATVMDDPLHIRLLQMPSAADSTNRWQTAQRLQNPLTVHVALAAGGVTNWLSRADARFSPLKAGTLLPNIHVVALRANSAATQTANVVTLFNTDQAGAPVTTFDLNALFASGELQLFQEMSVDGNLPLAQMSRMQWITSDADATEGVDVSVSGSGAGSGLPRMVSMKPGDLRTFRFNFLI